MPPPRAPTVRDSPGAADRLTPEFTAALNDDLNAPRALAALFDFVTEGNRLLDQGEKPGPAALRGVDAGRRGARCDDILGDPGSARRRYTPRRTDLSPTRPIFLPPQKAMGARPGPDAGSRLRSGAISPEADRIRALLAGHGFEIRDRKDGSVEVARK